MNCYNANMRNDFTLEKHRFFPYIAWAVCIGFAGFVGSLALELSAVTAELSAHTKHLETVSVDTTNRLNQLEAELEELQTN